MCLKLQFVSWWTWQGSTVYFTLNMYLDKVTMVWLNTFLDGMFFSWLARILIKIPRKMLPWVHHQCNSLQDELLFSLFLLIITPSFQIVSHFNFVQKQICLTLAKFIYKKKITSIYNIKQILYQNICHGVSNESSLMLYMFVYSFFYKLGHRLTARKGWLG